MKSGKIKPDNDGIYSCMLEEKEYPHIISLQNIHYNDNEWKFDKDKYSLLIWKKRALD